MKITMTFPARVSTLFLLFLCALVPLSAQTTSSYDFSAQAAAVSEFDVNGLKVILKRRPSSPTVAGGLFIRGGARNIDEKSAGIENLMLASAIDAGAKMPRSVVRREVQAPLTTTVQYLLCRPEPVSIVSGRSLLK